MGIAASQARFLGLTARKTNIEYEGQQVNQQRTALANESANAYNRLYTLTVPTPPSVTDFYKNEYTYSYGGNVYTIGSFKPSETNPGTYEIEVNSTETTYVPFATAHQNSSIYQNGNKLYISTGNSIAEISKEAVAKPDIKEKYGLDSDQFYVYTNSQNNTSYYISEAKYKEYTQQLPYTGEVDDYYYAGQTVNVTKKYDNVTLNFDENGNIKDATIPDQGGTALSVTTNSVKDEEAYNQAMKDYQKQHDDYDKEIAEINAETEKIQQQDRSLELRLKQLDTEREAVQTEMDSIKEVIKKNVDNIFKVFA
ncbi:MAG: hypothetical protein ACI4CY_07490 [Candidatus Gastranaerophilaceae bacterium]